MNPNNPPAATNQPQPMVYPTVAVQTPPQMNNTYQQVPTQVQYQQMSVNSNTQYPQPPASIPGQYQQIPFNASMQSQQIPPAQYQQLPVQIPMQQMPAQYIQQQQTSNNINCSFEGYGSQSGITLIGKDDKEYMLKKTAAIIVSICSGSSYDALFTSVQQKSQEGTKTLVYSVSAGCVNQLIQGFEDKSKDQTVIQMFKQIKSLDADCTVFNWECSSGYTSHNFPEGADNVMRLVYHIIHNKHMAMFSDFSLKALISQWNEEKLGPNPFRKMPNEFSETVCLKFQPQTLRDSPSAQLQSVGDLSDGGKCNVHCLGGTIVYSVDPKKADNNKYKLKILTIAQNAPVDNPLYLCKIKSAQGAAGHILLTYPNGGKILTSMGHWIELVKVDTSEQRLFQMAEKQYGTTEVMNLRAQAAKLSEADKSTWVQSQAQAYVQSSAPCNNFAQKANYQQYKG